MDLARLISRRARSLDASGIRRAFERSARLVDPINLSIGQPDFDAPPEMKQAVIDAVQQGRNGYTMTQGTDDAVAAVAAHLKADLGWDVGGDETGLLLTSGTTGALTLACGALLDEGDEAIMPDPYFVVYPALAQMALAKPVFVDTYPDFRMTAERVEPLINERTKLVIVNSPGNPTGVVLTNDELRDLESLCRSRGVVLISDEIYDAFTFSEGLEDGRFPTPAAWTQELLLIRGMSKTCGCPGWRLGYAAGPQQLISEMAKLQQYSFVCAPSITQAAVAQMPHVDLSQHVDAYERKRDMVIQALGSVTEVTFPSGAFYAFPRVSKGMTATEFTDQALDANVIVIPGHIFSQRDTHFRLSFAVDDDTLSQGLEILARLLGSA